MEFTLGTCWSLDSAKTYCLLDDTGVTKLDLFILSVNESCKIPSQCIYYFIRL